MVTRYNELVSQVNDIRGEAAREMEACADPHAVQVCRASYLRRKGRVTLLFREMGNASPDERPKLGSAFNNLKTELEERFDELGEIVKKRAVKLLGSVPKKSVDQDLHCDSPIP